MFIAAYDDRNILPNHFRAFVSNTIKFCDFHLITPAKQAEISSKLGSKSLRSVHIINPNTLPCFNHAKNLFDDLFFNYSTNSDKFERACFHRWFALNASTTALSGNDYICLLDTDFLIGINPSDLLSCCLSKTKSKDIKFIAEWAGDTPVSICPEVTILTKSYLYDFCKYLLTVYYSPLKKEQLLGEYFDRIGNGLPGGICDMRALADYSKLHTDNAFNLRKLDEPQLIENFNSFLYSNIGKTNNWKIIFQSDAQYLQVDNSSKKLLGTHFQGTAKIFMGAANSESGKLTRSICLEHLAEKKQMDKKKQTLSYRVTSRLRRVMKRLISL